jgi:hypothetical protein
MMKGGGGIVDCGLRIGDWGGFDLRGRFGGLEALLAGLFFLLVVAVADFVDHLGEGVVVLLAFLFQLGVAVGEDLVGLGVALGSGVFLGVVVVETLVGAEAAELV